MSICWYCYWGWSKPVAEIYLEAVGKLGGNKFPLHFGPAHVVWEDENWDFAEECLKDFDKYKGSYTEKDLKVVRWSLEELVKIPLDQREVEPEEYDGEHPELFPPQEGVEMIIV